VSLLDFHFHNKSGPALFCTFFYHVAWLVSVIDFYCPLFVIGVQMCLTKKSSILTCVFVHYMLIISAFDCGWNDEDGSSNASDRGILLVQAQSVSSSWETCCSQQRVKLPAETFEMSKCILTISLAKPS
jgi:hypothetical protein